MFLHGLGIGGYRSFGAVQYLAPLAQVNLVVGKNNSGKSNVLRLLTEHLDSLFRAATNPGGGVNMTFTGLDVHEPDRLPLRFSVGAPPATVRDPVAEKFPPGTNSAEALRTVVQALQARTDNLVWFEYQRDRNSNGDVLVVAPAIVASVTAACADAWTLVEQTLTNTRSGRVDRSVPGVVRHLSAPVFATPPDVALVPAVRQIAADEVQAGVRRLDGRTLIRELDALQHPSIVEQQKREEFFTITKFVQSVLEAPDAAIEVPSERDTIHVRLNGAWRTLDSLGTGIHETVMLAVFATIHRDQIVCIEEPELHLHPLLQQKLIRYLSDNTTNQYFISTHSAHLLATPNASVFHIRLESGQSIVERASTSAQRVRICADLGYRAADLIQSNAVLWVEGPSDRLYLRWWLNAVDDRLIDGIHYSIMFYGGRLLSHLSAGDEEVSEFISLRQINQYLAILIDSDRTKKSDSVNKTKDRVRNEFNAGPGFAWITQGREIENYVPAALIRGAVAAAHPGGISEATDTDRFADNLRYKPRRGKQNQADKIKVAHQVIASGPPDLARLDLRKQVERLVDFIRAANDLHVA